MMPECANCQQNHITKHWHMMNHSALCVLLQFDEQKMDLRIIAPNVEQSDHLVLQFFIAACWSEQNNSNFETHT